MARQPLLPSCSLSLDWPLISKTQFRCLCAEVNEPQALLGRFKVEREDFPSVSGCTKPLQPLKASTNDSCHRRPCQPGAGYCAQG